ncbi:ANTAR domain-containing response regulator [Beggiatoa leptomitoformis]|uniref:ANTAR domain-containing protein n=1 Tax=Beggiatoa leptomitoformis TaxID=288004 RepID=A0A2N9YHW8_9GAMM|nr:ANTAR domain-containing protein [Beggiatoa leptomitoformis]ALG67770.2 ANTAR domain-containing protein [Beggiatoa leptomitoformis]AUI69985.2 ANTAR domain-containing protein [Beggiatoa leptomitoformis]
MMKLRVVLIDEDRGRIALLKQALDDAGYEVVATLKTGVELLTQLEKTPADIIIIDLDSPDRDTLEYVNSLNREQPKPVIMFAEDDDSDMIHAAIKAGVSAYVVDGLSEKRVKSVLEVAIARFREYQAMRKELEDTKSKLAERKSIEKAKGILMQHKGLDEDSAYRALRKMAMDRNIRLAEVAEDIIAVAKLLI